MTLSLRSVLEETVDSSNSVESFVVGNDTVCQFVWFLLLPRTVLGGNLLRFSHSDVSKFSISHFHHLDLQGMGTTGRNSHFRLGSRELLLLIYGEAY